MCAPEQINGKKKCAVIPHTPSKNSPVALPMKMANVNVTFVSKNVLTHHFPSNYISFKD